MTRRATWPEFIFRASRRRASLARTMAMTVTPFKSTDLADIYSEMLIGVPSIDTLT